MTLSILNEIRGVLFDLDNTLHDRDEAFVAWARAFVRDDLGVVDACEARDAVAEMVALDRGGLGDKLAMFEAMRTRFPHAAKPALTMLDEFFANRTAYMTLSPGVTAVFDCLATRQTPWGIVTNGLGEQWDKIHRLGLDKMTQTIFVSSDFGVAKPDPHIFLAAAEKLGGPPSDILFVGDHPAADIGGAHGAGMRTAWLARGREWPPRADGVTPTVTLDAIAKLIPLLA